MKYHLLWFVAFLIAVGSTLYCFHVHEERNRFYKVVQAEGGVSFWMWDKKEHRVCVPRLPGKNEAPPADAPWYCGE